jgi:hypothetical protein
VDVDHQGQPPGILSREGHGRVERDPVPGLGQTRALVHSLGLAAVGQPQRLGSTSGRGAGCERHCNEHGREGCDPTAHHGTIIAVARPLRAGSSLDRRQVWLGCGAR